MAIGLPECGANELLLPDIVYITPSSVDAWREVRDPASRYTRMQLHIMKHDGIDAETVEDVIVRQSANKRELWWPYGQKAPVYLMPCPILGDRNKGGERQLLVLSPAAMPKWVHEDGTILGGKKKWRK